MPDISTAPAKGDGHDGFDRVDGTKGGVAISNGRWHIEIYPSANKLTLEIRIVSTGETAATADIIRTAKGIQVDSWHFGARHRLPQTVILDRADRFAHETVA